MLYVGIRCLITGLAHFRNFPTKANIAKKAQLRSEKQSRGEVVETKQFG